LADARFAVRTVTLQSVNDVEGKTIRFEAKGSDLTHPGWKVLVEQDQSEEKEEAKSPNPVPILSPEANLTADSGRLLEKKTKAPKRYTEASLVKELERKGIGRPSTYASIMENIIHSKNYIAIGKTRFLNPTEKGEVVIDTLSGQFSFLDYTFTKLMESQLDLIARGEGSYITVVSECHSQLTGELAQLSTSSKPKHPCPECGKPMSQRKKGKSVFWGCSGYPECKQTLPDNKGVPGERTAAKPELSEHLCPECDSPLIHRVKQGKKGFNFWGCSGFPKCKTTFENKDGEPAIDVEKESA